MAKKNNMFLTFNIGDETFGIPILQAKEIIGMMEIIRVPKLPKYMNGIINLRGKIIPIMDLRLRLDYEQIAYNERTSIIIVEFGDEDELSLNGIIVDTVHEVIEIDDQNIEKASGKKSKIDSSFIYGIGKLQDDAIIVLDVDKVLSDNK